MSYEGLSSYVKAGHILYIDDGYCELRVKVIRGEVLICKARRTFSLRARKSINIPEVALPFPLLSSDDKKDLAFIVQQDIDWIAASLISTRKNVDAILVFLKRKNSTDPCDLEDREREGIETPRRNH